MAGKTRPKDAGAAGRRQSQTLTLHAATARAVGERAPNIAATAHRRAFDLLIRPTRAEIDLAALRHNLAQVRQLAPHAAILAVVKANAYGHGAVMISQALEQDGVEMLGVALIEEGLELRNAGIRTPILVLGGAYEGGYELMVQHQLRPAVFRPEHLLQLAEAARSLGCQAKAHLKFDSGMGRIGLLPEELDSFLQTAASLPEVELEGILSHFASAELENEQFTHQQIDRFKDAHARMRALGFRPAWRHLSNSAGVMHLPEVRDGLELNMVRPGIMLYGLHPAPWLRKLGALRPVLSWKTGVVHLKKVPAGSPISYGGSWRASRESIIATVPVGYADGYSRKFSNRAQLLVRGSRAPVVGRVCMDMCMADVTDIPAVQVGDEVVLLGKQGTEEIGAEELAGLAQTINYEVICNVGVRVPRVAHAAT